MPGLYSMLTKGKILCRECPENLRLTLAWRGISEQVVTFKSGTVRDQIMATVFIRHRIKNYAKWKKAFEGFLPQRKAGGELSYVIGNVPGKMNNLCLLFQWDSAANAT